MQIRKYFHNQISEIQSDRSLKFYGMALAFVHLLSAFFWREHFPNTMHDPFAICWPYWENCQFTHGFSQWIYSVVMAIYAGLAIVCGFSFLLDRVKMAYYFSMVLVITKFIMLSQDYRLMGNYHYMPFFVAAAFLFVPNKTWTIKVLVTLFYVSAGTLKLNIEWLSGAAVGAPPAFLSVVIYQWLCAYVVFLELILVWGLWSRYVAIRWITFFLILMFHAVSWYWVGYFYPMVMAGLLSIFVLTWLAQDEHSCRLLTGLQYRQALGFLFFFVLCQLPPHLFSSDSALIGNHRLTSLNMFDARAVCVSSFFLKFKSETIEFIPTREKALRIRCDPILFLAEARNLCMDQGLNPEFVDLDLYLVAKRTTDARYRTLLADNNFCASLVAPGTSYGFFKENQ